MCLVAKPPSQDPAGPQVRPRVRPQVLCQLPLFPVVSPESRRFFSFRPQFVAWIPQRAKA